MENKKYPIGGFAPGYYHCKCFVCAERFQGDKRATMCEPCAIELAARPKEVADHIGEINGMVNQPVQQEEAILKSGFIPMCKKGDKVVLKNCIEAQSNDGKVFTVRDDSYVIPKGYSNEGSEAVFLEEKPGYFLTQFIRHAPAKSSTPIVSEGEQTICSVNCKCESGEDCDGESALNLIDLVEQQDRIAEIVEFVKSNLNTREEEVINIISDKYRITPIKNENI